MENRNIVEPKVDETGVSEPAIDIEALNKIFFDKFIEGFNGQFKPKFFEAPKKSKENDESQPDFPIPSKPIEVAEFIFKKKEFAEGIKALLGRLKTWAVQNGIADSHTDEYLYQFYSIFTDTKKFLDDEGNIDLNKTLEIFPLASQGLTQLTQIVTWIQLDNLPLSYRKDLIKALLPNLGNHICPAANLTHINDTHAKLKIDISNILADIKKEFGVQTIQLLMLKHGAELLGEEYNGGNDIHYANVVLNEFASALGIEPTEDTEIPRCCDPRVSEILINWFATIIPTTLTFEYVINQILKRLPITELKNDIKDITKIKQLTADFEKLLNTYGADSDFHLNTILNENDDGEYEISKDYEAYLFISILNRLVNLGNFLIRINNFTDDKKNEFVIPEHYDLKHACVITAPNKIRKPLLVFCIEQLKKEKLLEHPLYKHLDQHQQTELFIYLASSMEEKLDNLTGNQLITILSFAPQNRRLDFLLKLDREHLIKLFAEHNILTTLQKLLPEQDHQHLIELIESQAFQKRLKENNPSVNDHATELGKILLLWNSENCSEFLVNLDKKYLRKLIFNWTQLAHAMFIFQNTKLNRLPDDNFGILLTVLGSKHLQSIIKEFSEFLAVSSKLSTIGCLTLMNILKTSHIQKIFCEADFLSTAAILFLTNPNEYPKFLEKVGQEHVCTLIDTADTLLSVLSSHPRSMNMHLLMQLGVNHLQKIVAPSELWLVFSYLKDDERKTLKSLLPKIYSNYYSSDSAASPSARFYGKRRDPSDDDKKSSKKQKLETEKAKDFFSNIQKKL